MRERFVVKKTRTQRTRSLTLQGSKERKKSDSPNEGWEEDRVPTCTSRIWCWRRKKTEKPNPRRPEGSSPREFTEAAPRLGLTVYCTANRSSSYATYEHLEHLECSRQPHIQGRGAEKRTQRAG